MAKLKTVTRNALASSKFAEPGKRAYPIENRSHARNAKARASEMEHKGRISKRTEEMIDRKADRVLHKGKKK